MEEILHQLIDGLFHYRVSTIQGAARFLPSTVSLIVGILRGYYYGCGNLMGITLA